MPELTPVKQARKLNELFDNIREPISFFKDFELPHIDESEIRFRFQTLENILLWLSADVHRLLIDWKKRERI